MSKSQEQERKMKTTVRGDGSVCRGFGQERDESPEIYRGRGIARGEELPTANLVPHKPCPQ